MCCHVNLPKNLEIQQYCCWQVLLKLTELPGDTALLFLSGIKNYFSSLSRIFPSALLTSITGLLRLCGSFNVSFSHLELRAGIYVCQCLCTCIYTHVCRCLFWMTVPRKTLTITSGQITSNISANRYSDSRQHFVLMICSIRQR